MYYIPIIAQTPSKFQKGRFRDGVSRRVRTKDIVAFLSMQEGLVERRLVWEATSW